MEKSGGYPAALTLFICRRPGSYSKRFSRSSCPSPAAGPRQYNQHEVDYKRAANTLFQWDFDKFTTFCAFIKVPLQPYSLNWAMRLFFTDFTFSFCGWTTPLTPMQSKTIPPKTEGLIRPCPKMVYKQDPQAKKQQR